MIRPMIIPATTTAEMLMPTIAPVLRPPLSPLEDEEM